MQVHNIRYAPVATLLSQFTINSYPFALLRYDILLPNVTSWANLENVMQHIFPTTPIELGPGFIVGLERIVTKVSRSFAWAGKQSDLTLRVFDRKGFLTSRSNVKGPEVHVGLDGGARSFAVVSTD
jgi:hypothetical protein